MKKKIVIVACVAVLAAGLCGGIAYGANHSDTLLLKDSQRYMYAYITSIQGNEVMYMEVEETVVTAMLEENTENEDAASEENRQNVGERENNTEQSGAMQDMGGMPDMSNMQGDTGNVDRKQGFTRGEGEDRENTRGKSSEWENMQFGTVTETVTTYIPVGVSVHTASDVTTTFSRLKSGDLVKMLVETNDAEADIIEEIWMLQ